MPRNRLKAAVLLALLLSAPAQTRAQEQRQVRPTGMELQDFTYPFAVGRFDFDSQGQRVAMAYMDVKPAQPNGRTIVLLHGKNFCGATWEGTIQPMHAAGYRVSVPVRGHEVLHRRPHEVAGLYAAARIRAYPAMIAPLRCDAGFCRDGLPISTAC